MKIICESSQDFALILPVLRKRLQSADGRDPVWTIGIQCDLTGKFCDHIICYRQHDLTQNIGYLIAVVSMRTSETRRNLVIED